MTEVEATAPKSRGWQVGDVFLKRWWIIAGSIALVGLISTFSIIGYFNGIYNGSVERENRLNTQFLDNQNYLSAFISGFFEQVSVVKAGGAQLNTVLTDAVKGRYEGQTSARPSTGSLFSAILEAYPEASVAELQKNWGKIQSFIQAQREGYRNIQSKLLDMLREYDAWRQAGIFRHFFVSAMGIPSDRLVARIGDDHWKGDEARDVMYRIVLVTDVKHAYYTGEQTPLIVSS